VRPVVAQRYAYNGKELVEGIGLYDYGARWYDPAIGRFTGVDAMADDIMQINRSPYAYAWNDPVSITDPDGNCPWCIGAVIGATLDYGSQVAINYATGNENPWTDIDLTSIAVSAVSGATGAGLVSAVNKGSKLVKVGKTAQKLTAVAGEIAVDASVSAGAQLATTGEVDLETVAVSAVVGQLIRSPVRDKVKGGASIKQASLDKGATRTERIAKNTEARVRPNGAQKPKGRMSKANSQYSKASSQRQQANNYRNGTIVRSVGSGVTASGTAQKAYNYFRQQNNIQQK
jgi:RHS repeat-associated protein